MKSLFFGGFEGCTVAAYSNRVSPKRFLFDRPKTLKPPLTQIASSRRTILEKFSDDGKLIASTQESRLSAYGNP
jgi:hypothetical protein